MIHGKRVILEIVRFTAVVLSYWLAERF